MYREKHNYGLVTTHIQKMSRAKDLLEAVSVQTEFMQSQLGSFGEQIKTLGEIYAKAATELLNAPLRKVD